MLLRGAAGSGGCSPGRVPGSVALLRGLPAGPPAADVLVLLLLEASAGMVLLGVVRLLMVLLLS